MERRNGSTEYHGEARIPATASGPDPARVEAARKPARDSRNFLLAVAVGTGAALLGAVLWTAVVEGEFFCTGWIALLTAILVGTSVHRFAREGDRAFGFLSAGLSLFGCLTGDLLGKLMKIATDQWRKYPEGIRSNLGMLIRNPGLTYKFLTEDISVFDLLVGLLFYILPAYIGYRLAFRRGNVKPEPFLERRMDRFAAICYIVLFILWLRPMLGGYVFGIGVIGFTHDSWRGGVNAWRDDDGDGRWDDGEQPLRNVQFTIHAGSFWSSDARSAGPAYSDPFGGAVMDIGPPVFPLAFILVSAKAPENYIPTTPQTIVVTGFYRNELISFGFRYPEKLPAPTPRPVASIYCADQYLGKPSAESWRDDSVIAMAAGPDGSVWVITAFNFLIRYSSRSSEAVRYSNADILPDGDLHTVAVAPDGTPWAVTDNGAAYFDGNRWIAFPVDAADAGSIAFDSEGRIWFAHASGGITRWDPATGILESVAVPDARFSPEVVIEKIQASADGSLWMFGSASVYQFTPPPDSEWIVHKRDERELLGGLFTINAEAVDVVSREEIWLAGKIGNEAVLVQWNPAERTFQTYTYSNTGGAMIGGDIVTLAAATDHTVWIGLRKSGMMLFSPHVKGEWGGIWRHYYSSGSPQWHFTEYHMVADSDGGLWVCGDNDVVVHCVQR